MPTRATKKKENKTSFIRPELTPFRDIPSRETFRSDTRHAEMSSMHAQNNLRMQRIEPIRFIEEYKDVTESVYRDETTNEKRMKSIEPLTDLKPKGDQRFNLLSREAWHEEFEVILRKGDRLTGTDDVETPGRAESKGRSQSRRESCDEKMAAVNTTSTKQKAPLKQITTQEIFDLSLRLREMESIDRSGTRVRGIQIEAIIDRLQSMKEATTMTTLDPTAKDRVVFDLLRRAERVRGRLMQQGGSRTSEKSLGDVSKKPSGSVPGVQNDLDSGLLSSRLQRRFPDIVATMVLSKSTQKPATRAVPLSSLCRKKDE